MCQSSFSFKISYAFHHIVFGSKNGDFETDICSAVQSQNVTLKKGPTLLSLFVGVCNMIETMWLNIKISD